MSVPSALPPSWKEQEQKNLALAQEFVTDLQELNKRNTRYMALLRRNVGETLATARDVMWFYGTLDKYRPKQDEKERFKEDIFFLVATLMAFDKGALEKRSRGKGTLGKTLGDLARNGNKEAVERRFRILIDATLDSDGGEMPFRLRQMIKLALSKDAQIDWAQLLVDLRGWNAPSKYKQKQWARDFYGAPKNDDTAVSAAPAATTTPSGE